MTTTTVTPPVDHVVPISTRKSQTIYGTLLVIVGLAIFLLFGLDT